MSIANEILRQLGSGRFVVMTGAKNFLASGPRSNVLTFRLPSTPHFVKDGINCVRITLDDSDTYTVEFSRLWGRKQTPVASVSDVYNDQLRQIFENYTGLRTSL